MYFCIDPVFYRDDNDYVRRKSRMVGSKNQKKYKGGGLPIEGGLKPTQHGIKRLYLS